jgi:hypothetical protein
MSESHTREHQTKPALLLWGVFIICTILINGTIPFAFGADLSKWTYSALKSILIGTIDYAGLFLVIPLVLVKGWKTVRQAGFLIPLILAVAGIAIHPLFKPAAAVVILVLAYLHWRYDLGELGFRSQGWDGDLKVLSLMIFIQMIPSLLRLPTHTLLPGAAITAGLARLFANPASTVENMFYFGFLTERLAYKTKNLTPLLIGLMYTLHEMTNPEYWFEGINFIFVFVGISIWSAIYLWRRNVVVLWLGDGLGKMASWLIG